MELKLYDTLTRQKRVFTPLDSAHVRMYVCGPTVYDFAHIGNARPVIVFDVLFRLLRHIYGQEHVTYVRNVTDVDDKINARAAERGVPIEQVTEETYRNFKGDVAALGCLEPTVEPRATHHIDAMKELIERLVKEGVAYVAEDHVLFHVALMKDYGKLSNRSLDDMIAGARVEVAPYKKDAMDFVLWKPSKPGEPAWPSPCGIAAPGRPGWHIECSAMAWKHLGESFDIHGGGIDLVFPHHENEIAQSRCAFQTPVMANFWMHNGFLQVEGEKMAKSAGNFVTIRELLRNWKGMPWSGDRIRWAMLQTHYHQPIDWTFDNLLAARNELSDFYIHFRSADHDISQSGKDIIKVAEADFSPSSEIVDALKDDLNTPAAISCIRAYRRKLSRDRKVVMQVLRDLMFLGVVAESTRYVFGISATGDDWPVGSAAIIGSLIYDLRASKANQDDEFADEITEKARQLGISIEERGPLSINLKFHGVPGESIRDRINARDAARKAKDFAESDRIRDELAAMGVVLKDTKEGTTWEVAR